MKIHMHLEVELPMDHPFVALLRAQTHTFMKGKAMRLQTKEVAPEIVKEYEDRAAEIRKAATELVKFPDGVVGINLNNTWESADLITKEEEASYLAPPG